MTIDLLTRPCTLVQRGATTYDQYGDPGGTPINTTTVCELQPVNRIGSNIEIEENNVGITHYKIYLPGDIVPDNIDAILIDGETYELNGDATPRRNPRTGEMMFTMAWVRRVQ